MSHTHPTLPMMTWMVYTINETASSTRRGQWCWVAFGPRGSDSGVEASATDAVHKARAAAFVLDEPRPERAA